MHKEEVGVDHRWKLKERIDEAKVVGEQYGVYIMFKDLQSVSSENSRAITTNPRVHVVAPSSLAKAAFVEFSVK